MAEISLIDTSLRDGNQSLWGATGLTTGMMLAAAPLLERAGFHALDFISSTHMAMAVRHHRENPWERIRRMRALMPSTPLGFLTTGMRFISWQTAHDDLMRLAFALLIRAGIRRFAIMDPMNDMAAVRHTARLVRDNGGENIVGAVVYTVSPVHDDDFFVGCATELARSPDIDAVYLKDPGGLLTPERAKTLLPKLRQAVREKILELHTHCTLALGMMSCLEAAAAGVDVVHTAALPLANGPSQPAASRFADNLKELGHQAAVDRTVLGEIDAYFQHLAQAEGLMPGTPADFDAAYFRHQLPGGMLSTLKRQLAEIRQEHRLAEVMEEVARVRADLGYPIMVTPFSQVVGTQAVLNVIGPERYSTLPDELIRYAIGRFGAPSAPIAPILQDRIHSLPRTRDLMREEGMPSLSDLRRKLGRDLDDETFILRTVMPAEQVDAMLARHPASHPYNPHSRPLMQLIRDLAGRRDIRHIHLARPGLRLEMIRHDSST